MPNSDNKNDNSLTLEKLEIHKRLLMIEEYIREGKELRHQLNETMGNLNIRCKTIEVMFFGDPLNVDRNIRDGINRRIDALEDRNVKYEKNTEKSKGNFLKIAVGSITLAVGAFMMWVFKLIWGAVGK